MRDNRLANSVTVSVLLSGCLSGQASFADEAAPPVELPAVFTFSAGYKIDTEKHRRARRRDAMRQENLVPGPRAL